MPNKMRDDIMKIISWNVNGIRAIYKKGFLEWFREENPDILCLQETKASLNQLEKKFSDLVDVEGYRSYWNSSIVRKGYSGTVTYTKIEPEEVLVSVDNKEFDNEGRIVLTRFDKFTLLNVYFPNGQVGKGDKQSNSEDAKKRLSRLDYKLRFYDYLFDYIEGLRKKGESLVICGDYNTAHKEIDLARPKDNVENTGFLPEERAWMDKLVNAGYIDTFRKFHDTEEGWYTWWTYRGGARQRNVGWRIDYFFVSSDLEPALKSAFIMKDVMGSDHCPLGIELEL
jgi:exodeoxyribonuclease III